ncbi:hypothetical protein [Calditerrivibrio sp.]|uniref:hypothetical protein n=1 Tax=Calditerrivibrio sp. TaxID=2792612 RepID=UPI003D0B3A02
MRKLFIIISMLSIVVSVAYAKDLADVLSVNLGNAAKLSNDVIGTYFSPNNKSAFVISTVHNKGTKAYATGSMTTQIWEKSFAASDNNSSQLINTEPSSYSDNDTATIFSGFRDNFRDK